MSNGDNELNPTEEAALIWRVVERRLRERPCECSNCTWIHSLFLDRSDKEGEASS